MTRRSFTSMDTIEVMSGATDTNSTAQTNLWDSASFNGATVAGDVAVGRAYKVSAGGVFSTAATPGTIRFAFWASPLANGGFTPLVTPAANLSNAPWFAEATCVVTAIGTTGTLTGSGFFVIQNQIIAVSSNVASVDLTHVPPLQLSFTVTWGTSSASNTITCNWATVRSLN